MDCFTSNKNSNHCAPSQQKHGLFPSALPPLQQSKVERKKLNTFSKKAWIKIINGKTHFVTFS
jgi:hypothetical protein